MRPWLILSVTGLAFLSTVALARQGTVRTKDGKNLDGDVREGPQSVQVSRGPAVTQVPRDQVAGITYTGPTMEALQVQLKELKADDSEGRLSIAREAFRNGYYDLSRQAATEVLDKDPKNSDAIDLLDLIRRQLLLEARRTALENPPVTPSTEPGVTAPRPLPKAYLTDADINLLKQAELQRSDANRVRVRFENDVLRRYLTLPHPNPNFNDVSAFEQAMIIIQTGDLKLRHDVLVLSDPASIREFRQTTQRQILTGCATNACHGSFAGGRFVLFPATDVEPAAYTNFYILATYQTKGPGEDKSVFGGASTTRKMIDRLNVGRSLLLQYGLPPQTAVTPHPAVEGMRPVFASPTDPQFRRIADWITNSLTSEEPIYPITYTPPSLTPATVPVTPGPATRGAATRGVRPPLPPARPIPPPPPPPIR